MASSLTRRRLGVPLVYKLPSMGKLTALRAKDISPEIVLQTLQEESSKIKDIFAVVIEKDGTSYVCATGDLTSLCYASMRLNDLAYRYVRGEIIEE